jgi:hypothetical protein
MKFKTFVIILMILVSVMALGCLESQPSQTSKPTTISPTVTSATPVQTPEIYYVGETASDGVTNITLKGIRYTATINERKVLTAPPGSKYLILDISHISHIPLNINTFFYNPHPLVQVSSFVFR